jgi:hypothetical protein
LGKQHQFDPTHGIEIAETVGELPNTLGWATTEHCLETPLALVNVVGRRDDVLEPMLHVVDVLDDGLVGVIKRDGDHDIALDIFESCVGLNVFLHRFTNAT